MILPLQITRFVKQNGPLTKTISLGADGGVKSDGSACVMSSGAAWRVQVADVHEFGSLIADMPQNEALALGALRPDIHDNAQVVCKHRLNGATHPDVIARTGDFIAYQAEQPALVLIDFDAKGMPHQVKERIKEIGGLWPTLVSVLPDLDRSARVMRRSTSAGLFRVDTGAPLTGSGGVHVYIAVKSGADIERFLKTLHERCWLAGLGWMMVGAAGQLLERGVVDRMVGAPERLVFEADPILVGPVAQDKAKRQPVVTEGAVLDTVAACPPLSILEQSRLRELRAKEVQRLAPVMAKTRGAFIDQQSRRLAEHAGIDVRRARRVIERQCEGVLLPDLLLPFDDPEYADVTVAAVLDDAEKFEGATLADPLEGVEYGRCKARIMRRADGTPWIHSFAHGRSIYELKLDAHAATAALATAPPGEAAETFVRLALASDLDEVEVETLRNLAHERSGLTRRVLDRQLKGARKEQAAQQAQQERDRRLAERVDPRMQVPAPEPDGERLPVMRLLDTVLVAVVDPEPPMRDLDDMPTEVRCRASSMLHQLTSLGANDGEADNTRLPAPELPLLSRHDRYSLAHLVERHVEFVEETRDGTRSVALPPIFIEHYTAYRDSILPRVSGIVTMPLVLPDGRLFAPRGLCRDLKLVFRIEPELTALLPRPDECSPAAVAAALTFLLDKWLVDVAADAVNKCILIVIALTILERALLSERPAFFVSAGQRGTGKTTVISMILLALTGKRPAAAAWSTSEEERRKALLAYFGEGLPALIWDNISRGANIHCPHIEASLTAETYSDRVLGVSEFVTVSATTIQIFTGNNIGPRGDMTSRSVSALLSADRPDPENREFRHPDPLGWTQANRGEILRALYTILLGNPQLKSPTPAKTRFKLWWTLCAAAVEHAASQYRDSEDRPIKLDFSRLFLVRETEDEQASAIATALELMRRNLGYARAFAAADVVRMINDPGAGGAEDARELKDCLDAVGAGPMTAVTAKSVTWRLNAMCDAPASVAGKIVMLSKVPVAQDKDVKAAQFILHVRA